MLTTFGAAIQRQATDGSRQGKFQSNFPETSIKGIDGNLLQQITPNDFVSSTASKSESDNVIWNLRNFSSSFRMFCWSWRKCQDAFGDISVAIKNESLFGVYTKSFRLWIIMRETNVDRATPWTLFYVEDWFFFVFMNVFKSFTRYAMFLGK